MSVDTKVFVMVNDSEKLKLIQQVTKEVNNFLRNAYHGMLKGKGEDHSFRSVREYKDSYSFQSQVSTRDCKTFTLIFNVFSESRMLWMNTICDCDYHEVGEDFNKDTTGSKVIFSLGHWGHHKEIMQVVIDSIKEFGDTYYIENDCSGDWVKI